MLDGAKFPIYVGFGYDHVMGHAAMDATDVHGGPWWFKPAACGRAGFHFLAQLHQTRDKAHSIFRGIHPQIGRRPMTR